MSFTLRVLLAEPVWTADIDSVIKLGWTNNPVSDTTLTPVGWQSG